MFYYMFSVCKINIESAENPTLLDCLQVKYDGPSEGQYVYTYIDAYGEEQTSTYNWGGERNFIEHMNNHFDSSYSCVALEVTNYAFHGSHLSHSRYNDPGMKKICAFTKVSDNKFHTTTSYQFDNQYGSLFCNPFTLNSRNSFFENSTGFNVFWITIESSLVTESHFASACDNAIVICNEMHDPLGKLLDDTTIQKLIFSQYQSKVRV